jgi:hypothetical protein
MSVEWKDKRSVCGQDVYALDKQCSEWLLSEFVMAFYNMDLTGSLSPNGNVTS